MQQINVGSISIYSVVEISRRPADGSCGVQTSVSCLCHKNVCQSECNFKGFSKTGCLNCGCSLMLLCCSVIDGVASGSGSKSENFRRVADKVFEDGITWERIAVLIYVAGRLAVKVSWFQFPGHLRI